MDFSEAFGFLIILKESIKILPKNGKFIASIAMLSLLIPSILVVSFSYFFQTLTAKMNASYMNPSDPDDSTFNLSPILTYLALILAIEIVFLLVYFVTSHVFSIATILVSATSYTDQKLTLKDLFSSIKRTWKRPLSMKFLVSRHSYTRYLSFAVMLMVFFAVIYPNFITISISIIIGIIVVVFQLHSSVVLVLSTVVSVLEDSSRKEALEKSEKLVKGQHLHGFMFNLFLNLLALIVMAVLWMVWSDKGSLNLTVYGLFSFNVLSLLMMLIFMGYTVFYFQCKKYHGEEIDILGFGDLQYYSQVPGIALGGDIP